MIFRFIEFHSAVAFFHVCFRLHDRLRGKSSANQFGFQSCRWKTTPRHIKIEDEKIFALVSANSIKRRLEKETPCERRIQMKVIYGRRRRDFLLRYMQ
jgi:hypothetical protein